MQAKARCMPMAKVRRSVFWVSMPMALAMTRLLTVARTIKSLRLLCSASSTPAGLSYNTVTGNWQLDMSGATPLSSGVHEVAVSSTAGGVTHNDISARELTINTNAVTVSIGAIAVDDVWPAGTMPQWVGALPPNVQNAPMLVEEIRDQVADWQPGKLPHVVNLTLLPVTPEDIGFLDHHLGTGRVLMLSRGYGNCRISNTRMPNCWRVVYYNSMDKVILNTVEVVDMPEVAMAAPEDLRDSHDRLLDLVTYLEQA